MGNGKYSCFVSKTKHIRDLFWEGLNLERLRRHIKATLNSHLYHDFVISCHRSSISHFVFASLEASLKASFKASLKIICFIDILAVF